MTSDIGMNIGKQLVLVSCSSLDNSKKVTNSPEGKKYNDNDSVQNSTYGQAVAGGGGKGHLEPRPFRPFKSSEEYLYAMKEDLAEWLNALYNLNINVDNFMEKLETGVILCRHANNIIRKARASPKLADSNSPSSTIGGSIPTEKELSFRVDVTPGTFHARDNVSNFIAWCRKLGIMECLLFETDDLVLRKNEKSFILCLLEIARQGTKIGMIAPMLVQLEQEIDREIAQDAQSSENDKLTSLSTVKDGNTCNQSHPTSGTPSSRDDDKENRKAIESMKNLHEMVVDILSRCSCPSAFPMVKVAEGKYRIGDTKVLIFVRILRSHVMVRVGGGWDTLGHYLDRHDPCRCRAGHRFSTSAKVTFTEGGDPSSGPQMVVTYNRPEDPVSTPLGQINSTNSINSNNLINRVTLNQSPNHNLKRRASGPVTSDYQNGTPSINGGSSGKFNGTTPSSRLTRRDSITTPVNINEMDRRFPSSISTSSTLSSSSSTSSSGYPDGLLIDRQESRTSHYSDDSSTDTSSVIMESPSPSQQYEPQSDVDCDQQSILESTKLIKSDLTSTTINKKPTTTPSSNLLTTTTTAINRTRGNYNDSSSSEFSESEINNNNNSGKNSSGGSSRRRCSPRKIMKTSDLLGTEKPSWASDDFIIDDKESLVITGDIRDFSSNSVASNTTTNVSSSPLQRNCRYRRSEQKVSSRVLTNNLTSKELSDNKSKNKSLSSENLSIANTAGCTNSNWKNPLNGQPSISSSPTRKVSSPKRGTTNSVVKEPPISCFERGRNYYASLPRIRSSSSSSTRTPLTDPKSNLHPNGVNGSSSPFVRGSPGRYSLRTPRGSLPESVSLNSCRADRFGYGSSSGTQFSRQNSSDNGETLRTRAFKSRTRPALDPDLFTKPCDSSRLSFRYGHRPTIMTTPNSIVQRSRSSDASSSRVALHSSTGITNGHDSYVNSNARKHDVQLYEQLNTCDQVKSSSIMSDDVNNNNNFALHSKKLNDDHVLHVDCNEGTEGDSKHQSITPQNDDILKKMEVLINKYQSRVERATPCKIVNNSSESINLETSNDGKSSDPVINCSHQKCNSSKIPMPIRSTPRKES